MALTGSFIHYYTEEDETLMVSSSITYPTYLEEDDDNYDKRGTTEEVLIPHVHYHSASYEGYGIIYSLSLTKFPHTNDQYHSAVTFRMYNDYSSSITDRVVNHFTIQDHFDTIEFDFDTPVHTQMYDHLKTLPSFVSMSDSQ